MHSPSEFATYVRRKKCGGMEASDAGRRNPTGRIQIRPALSQGECRSLEMQGSAWAVTSTYADILAQNVAMTANRN